MIFLKTSLQGAYLIALDKKEDDRGFFARAWCKNEFEAHGLDPDLVQCNIAFNKLKGTLRGMHYQAYPYSEVKLIRCIRGAIYDVIIDLRQHSCTFKQWYAVELNSENRNMLYIPEGFAHGYQTLEDATEVFYQVSQEYHPESEMGVRWNDPAFSIVWPDTQLLIMSEKDKRWNDYINR